VKSFTGRRWNGAERNRLELAKSGPSPADVSLEAASADSSARLRGLPVIAQIFRRKNLLNSRGQT
jgi:hypothetical protein